MFLATAVTVDVTQLPPQILGGSHFPQDAETYFFGKKSRNACRLGPCPTLTKWIYSCKNRNQNVLPSSDLRCTDV